MSPANQAADETRREKLLPQASIRFFLLTIGGSAIIMVIFRIALIDKAMWAQVLALMLSATLVPFVTYIVLFLLASCFAVTSQPLRSSLKQDPETHNSHRKLYS